MSIISINSGGFGGFWWVSFGRWETGNFCLAIPADGGEIGTPGGAVKISSLLRQQVARYNLAGTRRFYIDRELGQTFQQFPRPSKMLSSSGHTARLLGHRPSSPVGLVGFGGFYLASWDLEETTTMHETKQQRLEIMGWKVGTTEEFLRLTLDESAYVELRLTLREVERAPIGANQN